jgi:hypothetical protein
MKKIFFFYTLVFLPNLASCMQDNPQQSSGSKTFTITVDADTGSVQKKKPKRHSVEAISGYDSPSSNPDNDHSYVIGSYPQRMHSHLSPDSDEVQQSQEDS